MFIIIIIIVIIVLVALVIIMRAISQPCSDESYVTLFATGVVIVSEGSSLFQYFHILVNKASELCCAV